jgi:hypothetical protein
VQWKWSQPTLSCLYEHFLGLSEENHRKPQSGQTAENQNWDLLNMKLEG